MEKAPLPSGLVAPKASIKTKGRKLLQILQGNEDLFFSISILGSPAAPPEPSYGADASSSDVI